MKTYGHTPIYSATGDVIGLLAGSIGTSSVLGNLRLDGPDEGKMLGVLVARREWEKEDARPEDAQDSPRGLWSHIPS